MRGVHQRVSRTATTRIITLGARTVGSHREAHSAGGSARGGRAMDLHRARLRPQKLEIPSARFDGWSYCCRLE